MSFIRIAGLTSLAMLAFAGNSLLCRAALKDTDIDPASFTSVRLISGALMLWLIVRSRQKDSAAGGNWRSALTLFAYASTLSWASVSLPAATGALLLFGAVQATMIGYATWTGERLQKMQLLGLLLAFGGLIGLLLPGVSTPPLQGSLLMILSGIAWGVYSLRGKGAKDPIKVTAGNFMRTVPLTAVLSLLLWQNMSLDSAGVGYAIASGALTSAIGYSIWYTLLPALKSSHAATLQLSAPVLTAIGGVLLLSEPITLRLVLASVTILGGIALVIVEKRPVSNPQQAPQ